ncbi:histidine kinase [Streptomyces sp. NPDC000410]|uniref:sensor histidine kinase n=1 Tax=Streptomyces sp. NPDC000410 TaxID=3154254 RepID=UPI003319C88A
MGGALLMPFWLVGTMILSPFIEAPNVLAGTLAVQFGAYAIALPLAAIAALFPLARPMSVAVARVMCGVAADRFADGPARSRQAKARTAAWFTLHVGIGGLVSAVSLALPPFAVTLMALPFSASLRDTELVNYYWPASRPWVVTAGVVAAPLMMLALAACAAGAGALLARQAPLLLGPTPEDRLAAAERRAAELAVRNRLARELHDSVGHALSAVTLQAGAARRVLNSDAPADMEFVREALSAIEETTRRTVGELDSVLGLLRQGDDNGELPTPGLDALDGLLLAHGRRRVAYEAKGDPAAVPDAVSREAYRIVQEGLTNALRYGDTAPVSLHLHVHDTELEITMENPLPDRAPVVRPGGGRGLRGIAERAALLGGRAEAGPHGDRWRLTARIPLGDGR